MNVRLENVTKRYNDVFALRNINLEIKEGEYVAVLGPSGCGKTTLIKMISGIEKPTEGRVYFDEKDVTRLEPSLRGFGYVFQNIALFPHMSLSDNISFPLKIRNVDRAERGRIVKQLQDMFNLSRFEKQYPRELPSGMQQATGVARALATQKDLMLLDEPLSALDTCVRKKLRQDLRKLLKDMGITALHVTHDQEEALAVADRVILMRSGRCVEDGRTEDIYRGPKTLFGAFFIGEINFFECVVKSQDEVETELGDKIELRRDSGLQIEKKVVIAIRPENIIVGESKKNCIRARFVKSKFMGTYIFHLFTYGDGNIKVVSYDTEEAFNNNEEVSLTLPRDALMTYPIPPEGITKALSLEEK